MKKISKPLPFEQRYPVMLKVFKWWEVARGYPASMEKVLKEYARAHQIKIVSDPGRNEQCPCGSGKKFKKCHGG